MLLSSPPEEYKSAFSERIQPRLKQNLLAPFLAPLMPEARHDEATAHCRLEFLKAGIDVLRRGEKALRDHPDPYGKGPFEYAAHDGGFELRSQLVYFVPIRLGFGMPHY